MKQFKTYVNCFLLIIFSAGTLITGCRVKQLKNTTANKPHTEFDAAMEYEFIMARNPATGAIPEGVYAAELAQAKSIFNNQPNNIVSANSYLFQGPNNLGGRTRAVVYDKRYNGTSNRIIMAGGVSGGVYKSVDDGATWVRKSPTGEHFSCTSIAQDTRGGMEDTWYYTVGEASGNSASVLGAGYSGNGVYKSIDNGETWFRLTSSNTTALESFSVPEDYISRVVVNPGDGYVYIACAAVIRRSVDGGTTWESVLPGVLSSSSQFTDIAVTSAGRLYAAFGGTNGSGVDGVWASPPGATSGDVGAWTRIAGAGSGGSPVGWNSEPFYGRVVLAISPGSESIVYALYYAGSTSTCGSPFVDAELFRWDDGLGSWTDLSATLPDEGGCLAGNDPFACQGGYDLVIAVKPDDASTLFIGGTNAYRSGNGGLTWTRIGGYASPASYSLYASSHPDIHSFTFQPTSSTTMLCGNDGGIQRTTDNLAATVAWTPVNTGYRTYQYYHVTLDPRGGNDKVLGGAQDNGSTRNIGGTGTSFEMVYGGDGVSVGLSGLVSGSTYEYVGSQSGYINRRSSVSALGATTDITPTGEGGGGLFVTMHKLDADNSELLYYANDHVLYRTTSGSTVTSATWTTMSGVGTAVSAIGSITAMATTRGIYSPATASLFIGASDVTSPLTIVPKVFRLDDPAATAAGSGPVDISGTTFPAGGFISSIAVNPRNDDTLLVTLSNYGITSVYWTGDANAATPTWTSVEGTLTLPSFRSSSIALTSAGVDYFVGTSVGLYTRTGLPAGGAWAQEGPAEMGNAVISSLALRPIDNKLLVGTHGYGMWYTYVDLAPVPVTLTEFTGTLQQKNALLQWKTSQENNSKHFELERSFDGISFNKIAVIPAAGNSSTQRSYSYTDKLPLTEKNYYRLRSVDMDGNFKLTNIVIIKLPTAQQDMLVLGNPFPNDIVVQFVKATESAGELSLFDMSGRLYAKQSFKKGEQQIRFKLPAGQLSKGTYLLKAIIMNGSRFTAKVIKE